MPRHASLATLATLGLLAATGCVKEAEPRFNTSYGTAEPQVKGRVCSPNGYTDVVAAYVYIGIDADGDGNDDERFESYTNGQGAFTLAGVPAGEHTLVVEKGSFSVSLDIAYEDGEVLHVGDLCLDASDVNIAVVTGDYDKIGEQLERLGMEIGEEHTYEGITGADEFRTLLEDEELLATYDQVFLNCGFGVAWMGGEADGAQPLKAEWAANLNAFIENGGSVYTSDWAYFMAEGIAPDNIDFYGSEDESVGAPLAGVAETVTADVHDPNIKELVGERVPISYDLDIWAIAQAAADHTDVLLTADVSAYQQDGSISTLEAVPLAVRFVDTESDARPPGQLIYTTFHNEQQMTERMEAILFEFILSM